MLYTRENVERWQAATIGDIMNLNVIILLFLTKCTFIWTALANHWEKPNELLQGRITGGQEAVPHSHPYLVSLQLRVLWARAHLCGGTILTKYWVLSAGHCVTESWVIRWLPMDAVVGAHDVDHFGPATQVSSISKRVVHPHYKGGISPNDIAVLKTSTPFYFTKEVQPINLPVEISDDPDYLKLAGWGVLKTTFFFPDLPDKLQEANVTYIPYEECYQAIENMTDGDEENPLNEKVNICSGPLTGGIAGCNGDSGGPLIYYMDSKKYYASNEIEGQDYDYDGNYNERDNKKIPVVLGVVSWGVTPCGRRGAPTVYTKVSKYLDFINQYISS